MISVFGNSFGEDDLEAIRQVMDSHLVGMGRVTEQFEKEFAARIGFKHGVAVNSCTNGSWALFKALNLPEDSEIIIPNIHFFGVRNILQLFSLKIVIADVEMSIPNLSFESLKTKITNKTRAIIFLEYGGYPVSEIEVIKKYLQEIGRADILLILDAANSPFTQKNGSYTALAYDVALYSYDLNKILVTGDGGMILSNNSELARKIKSLSYYGIEDSSKSGFEKSQSDGIWWEVEITTPSLKLAMNNLTAALGRSQLSKVDHFLGRRQQIRQLYLEKLSDLQGLVTLPPQIAGITNNLYLFWIALPNSATRNALARHLRRQNIYSTVKYQPLEKLAATPNSSAFYDQSLCLPFNQNLSDEEISYITDCIKVFV